MHPIIDDRVHGHW